jgi:hypothetical protein
MTILFFIITKRIVLNSLPLGQLLTHDYWTAEVVLLVKKQAITFQSCESNHTCEKAGDQP